VRKWSVRNESVLGQQEGVRSECPAVKKIPVAEGGGPLGHHGGGSAGNEEPSPWVG